MVDARPQGKLAAMRSRPQLARFFFLLSPRAKRREGERGGERASAGLSSILSLSLRAGEEVQRCRATES